MSQAKARIFVSGKVQRVFFRHNTQKKAKELGITGWVRNLSDGRVEAVLEGEKEKIEQMIEWVKKGPSISRVDSVEVAWEEYESKDEENRFSSSPFANAQEFNDFEIKND